MTEDKKIFPAPSVSTVGSIVVGGIVVGRSCSKKDTMLSRFSDCHVGIVFAEFL